MVADPRVSAVSILRWLCLSPRTQDRNRSVSLVQSMTSRHRQIPHSANWPRSHLYQALEARSEEDGLGYILNWFIAVLICASVLATVLESVPELRARYAAIFRGIEYISISIFSFEYLVRIWIAPEHVSYQGKSAFVARLRYIISAWGLIDLLAVAPLWFAIFGSLDLRGLVVFRMIRILKLVRYSSGMSSLMEVLWAERRALGACLIILICCTVISASLMHTIEGTIQKDKFGTIPDAMWWSLVTLTTIGYGDVVPLTGIGKLVAAGTIIGGLIMIALPVGIIAHAFSDVIHRRDFVITWSMIAQVPAFSHLKAENIAEVMGLLRARRYEKGEIIVRRGDRAHAMYFVASGTIEIELAENHKVQLSVGQFFGEQALLSRTRRSGTAKACTRAKLLVLDAADLEMLIEREPYIASHIRRIASQRAENTPQTGASKEPPAVDLG